MENLYTRTQMLVGDNIEKLKNAKVIVFGLGGVGGYVVEALARAGIGAIDVVDNDVFSNSNLNRQILATTKSIGRRKTEVAIERIGLINPQCVVKAYDMFYLPENANDIILSDYDYIIDAIDTVSAKLELIARAKTNGVNVISCMGTGNKLGVHFEVEDIFKTSVCPLAKVMRKQLRERGIESLKVVYSKEEPCCDGECIADGKRHIPGSISYAPAIAGLVMASEVIKDLLAK